MEFDIKVTAPAYDDFADAWATMRITNDGEDAVKAAGERFLPMKSGIKAMTDAIRKNDAYAAYKARAEFPEIVAPTVQGSVGLMTVKPAKIEMPSGMEYLRETATLDGLTLDGLYQREAFEAIRMGRYGLFPGVRDDGTFYLAGYCTEAIRNWATEGGKLVYLVLDETSKVRNPDTNKWELDRRFRECYLNEAGYFETREWVKVAGTSGADEKFAPQEPITATIKGGKGLDFIPFVFVGSTDLTPEPDDIPLYGLAKLALRAYRLDADYTTALHMTAEPTPYVTGVSKEDAPTTIGAQSLWVLPEPTSKAEFLEFSGQGIDAQQKAIQDTLERAVVFGAQLFSDSSRTKESGEAIKLRLGSQHATLHSVATTVAAGMERALRFIAIWAGMDPKEITVVPNLDFVDRTLTAQDIDALVRGWQGGAYSKRTLFDNLQRGEVIPADRTYEDEQAMLETEGPNLTGSPLSLAV